MKPIIVLIIGLLISISSFAQQGINYKALIEDDLGNVVSNQTIGVQFQIREATANGTPVYTETNTSTTDANGVVILNIGTGNTSDIFNAIDWGAKDHWLNLQIDIAGGTNYIDMSTTQFMAVPYALSAANVSGLEKITENDGTVDNTGWRLFGANLDNYGSIGSTAVDLSISPLESTQNGATGLGSFAAGVATIASADGSTAMGNQTRASGALSIAMGDNTLSTGNISTAMGGSTESSGFCSTVMGNGSGAIGDVSTAMGKFTLALGENATSTGFRTIASGVTSTAMGLYTTAPSYAEIAVGAFNTTYTPNNTTGWGTNDRLFTVGNGSGSSLRSDALTVFKNGSITAPSLELANIADNKSLVTKEFVDANITGLERLNEGNGPGFRLIGRNPEFHGPIGLNAVDLSYEPNPSTSRGATGERSIAIGNRTQASGDESTAMGSVTRAIGEVSTAMGYFTIATGLNSTAMGSYTSASGIESTAMGYNTSASGLRSTAIGADTNAQGDNSTAMGNNTIASGDNSLAVGTWNTNDPSAILMIGNGTSANANTAFKIMNDGNAVFDGEIQKTATGNANLVPIAYGTVESNANVLSGTGNITASITAGVITISINGESMNVNNTSCIITPYSTAFRTSSIVISNGDIQVRTFNSSGTLAPVTFQFVIYKL